MKGSLSFTMILLASLLVAASCSPHTCVGESCLSHDENVLLQRKAQVVRKGEDFDDSGLLEVEFDGSELPEDQLEPESLIGTEDEEESTVHVHGDDLPESPSLMPEGVMPAVELEKPDAPTAHETNVVSEAHKAEEIFEPELSSIGSINDDNKGRQACYISSDNIMSVFDQHKSLNQNGQNKAQWARCLPPPMYSVLTLEGWNEGDIRSGEYTNKMKGATDLYTSLKHLHNQACAHVKLSFADAALQQSVKDDLNYKTKPHIGVKINAAVQELAAVIVDQYRSIDPAINKDNAKFFSSLDEYVKAIQDAADKNDDAAVGAAARNQGDIMKNALNTDFVTIKGDRQYTAVRPLRNVETALRYMKTRLKTTRDVPRWLAYFQKSVDGVKKFLTTHAPAGKDFLAKSSLGGKQAMALYHRSSDCALKGGSALRASGDQRLKGYTIYTLSLGQDANGAITVQTKDGNYQDVSAVTEAAGKQALKELLKDGSVFPEKEGASYQDDIFSQGNLACSSRKDKTWTLVTADRNDDYNTVTATQDEGYFCIWAVDDIDVLPQGEKAGYSNTELTAESPEAMAKVLGGEASQFQKFFGDKMYYHCHYTPRNNGAMRVRSFQHQAERLYPKGIRHTCSCDWRKLGMLVSRCDCTVNGQANGGCRRVEMEMLNEHTQVDLAKENGGASRTATVHGDLANGVIKSYDYKNDNNKAQEQGYQKTTGRVRATSNGNDAVCSVKVNGVPDNNVRRFSRFQTEAKGKKSWYTDFDSDGGKGRKEFYLADIKAYGVPSGGTNLEFVDADEKPCDALKMGNGCRAADAGKREGDELTAFLGGFCETPTALFSVPVDDKGQVPRGFGGARRPLPLPEGKHNYRTFARNRNDKDWLFCEGGKCKEGSHGLATQGTFSESGDFATTVGGSGFAAGADETGGGSGGGSGGSGKKGGSGGSGKKGGSGKNKGSGGSAKKGGTSGSGKKGSGSLAEVSEEDVDERYLEKSVQPGSGGSGNKGSGKKPGSGNKGTGKKGSGKKGGGGTAQPDYENSDPSAVPAGWTDPEDDAFGIFYRSVMHGGAEPEPEPEPEPGSGKKGSGKKGTGKKGSGSLAETSEEESAPTWSRDNTGGGWMGGGTGGQAPEPEPEPESEEEPEPEPESEEEPEPEPEPEGEDTPQFKHAMSMVKAENGRANGVTCLNGKYVYVREYGESRPVVSTIREAYNKGGPERSGQWACRYLGVLCNNGNCDNNAGATEVPGPFVAKSADDNESGAARPEPKPEPRGR